MFKSILVQVNGTETDEVALATALQAARLFGSHIECLRVRMDTGAMIGMAAGVSMAPAGAIAETFDLLKKDDESFTAQARRTFDDFCRNEGIAIMDKPSGADSVSASWSERRGDAASEIVARGRFNDLVVVSRKSKNFIGLTPSELGAIVLDCGRPIIIAGPQAPERITGKIAIAWKDTAEAARVITASTPLLSRASRVTVLSANEDGDDGLNCVECAGHIANSLRWHKCTVDVKLLIPGSRKISDTILEGAQEANAAFLIAGAYGHSRLRELVFGGFTQHLLERAPLPVLLFH